jgi:hypothetical protein
MIPLLGVNITDCASNGDFSTTTNTEENVFLKDGELWIKPSLQDENLITHKNVINLSKQGICTSHSWDDCHSVTNTTNGIIVNPVKSARINTKKGATIQYGEYCSPISAWCPNCLPGKVEVEASMLKEIGCGQQFGLCQSTIPTVNGLEAARSTLQSLEATTTLISLVGTTLSAAPYTGAQTPNLMLGITLPSRKVLFIRHTPRNSTLLVWSGPRSICLHT